MSIRLRILVGVTLATLAVGALHPRLAHAGGKEDLAAARALFAEALKDEQAGDSAVALEKFQRVQQVKDTPQVRYRIGSCLEHLGKLKSAREAYQAAAALGEGDRSTSALVSSSRERVSALTRRIPDVTLSPDTPTPSDAVVKVDDAVVPASQWQTPLALDPGDHRVAAEATGYEPFHTTTTLAEGAHATVTIPWTKSTTPPPNDGAIGAGAGQGGSSQGGAGPAGPQPGGGDHPPPPSSGSGRTWGWVAVGAGSALLVGSGVVVLLRHGEISTIKDACTNGVCPRSRASELQSAHDRAVTEGTLSLVLAGAGVVAVGVGVTLLLTSHGSEPAEPTKANAFATHVLAGVDAHGGTIGWRGTF